MSLLIFSATTFIRCKISASDIEISKVRRFEKELLEYLKGNTDILTEIADKKALDKDLEERLKESIANFKKSFN